MIALPLAQSGAPQPWIAERPTRRRLQRRHVLMLVLAAEILLFGAQGVQRRRDPGITVDVPSVHGHVIT